MKKFFIPFVFVLSLFSCNIANFGTGLDIVLPGSAYKGAAYYTVDEVTQYEVQITAKNGLSQKKRGRPGEVVPFEGLSTGSYTVDVWALDSSDYTAAYGTKTAVVKANEITPVDVEAFLAPKNTYFINTVNGAWSRNWRTYFRDNTYYNARYDFDFGRFEETSAVSRDGGPVELTRKQYTYAKVINPAFNHSQIVYDSKFSVPASGLDIILDIKAEKPSDVVFVFQDYKSETEPLVFQTALSTEYRIIQLTIPQRENVSDATQINYEGTLSFYITSENGKVTFSDPDYNDSFNTPDKWNTNYTAYPYDRKIVSAGIPSGTDRHFVFNSATASYPGAAGGVNGLTMQANKMYTVKFDPDSLDASNVKLWINNFAVQKGWYTSKAVNQSFSSSAPIPVTLIFPGVIVYPENQYEYASLMFNTTSNADIVLTRSSIEFRQEEMDAVSFFLWEVGTADKQKMEDTGSGNPSSLLTFNPSDAKTYKVMCVYGNNAITLEQLLNNNCTFNKVEITEGLQGKIELTKGTDGTFKLKNITNEEVVFYIEVTSDWKVSIYPPA
ncbi:MAG: hypothetical protein MJ169_00570 [Treponema sp.]|nr:hypothetical protein [Treponema sp.]